MSLPLLSRIAPLLFRRQLSTTTASIMADKQVIVTFKKGASSADKAAILNGVVAKGGKVVDKSDADSSIFPYAVVSISPDSFAALQSASLDDKHDVIKGVEEDKEVRIQ
ncbi:uncharacterized protein LOC62_06G008363 [Vanrija pseudolonga]|uniref:Inhibitor I9 domain-containing protein n=1 Tax=Vanrija pseudolonga TaxID=143232 RepID=A0AAF0YJQ5_9TREE|nr:hypothetical protein LOC62_06G008363 [Vanrija pseudolonga]